MYLPCFSFVCVCASVCVFKLLFPKDREQRLQDSSKCIMIGRIMAPERGQTDVSESVNMLCYMVRRNSGCSWNYSCLSADLKIRRLPTLSKWAWCNHKHPLNMEEGGRRDSHKEGCSKTKTDGFKDKTDHPLEPANTHLKWEEETGIAVL